MDILPSGNIFRELQDIHDTGYFSAQPSLEDHWQQVRIYFSFTFGQVLRAYVKQFCLPFALKHDGTSSRKGSISRYECYDTLTGVRNVDREFRTRKAVPP
ncbi:Krueppel-like factor 7 [Dufourea novaeangliae]|uniref:Krueppel-like factor 7 n=1 Tax=Dufourea novaeangliae TaxID=178035 RepID=A0A154NYZ1_DUFNO|nr:Krueppel-like factor 7 [Dufourea novaeangliae]